MYTQKAGSYNIWRLSSRWIGSAISNGSRFRRVVSGVGAKPDLAAIVLGSNRYTHHTWLLRAQPHRQSIEGFQDL